MILKKAILYIREASIMQTGHNTASNQERMLRNYCAIHNIQAIGVYKDVSSGKHTNLPGFQKLLNFLEQHRGVADYILFTSWDRLSRDFDVAFVMTEELNELGVEARAIQENDLLRDFLLHVGNN